MYSDIHKSFLQSCSNHGSLTKSNALEILKSTVTTFADGRDCSEEALEEIIEEINDKISFIDQKIVIINHEILSDEFIVITSTVTDPINKCRSEFTVGDRKYFALLLKEITKMPNHCLGLIAATNIIIELKDKKLSKQHASKLLETWIEYGYFTNCNDVIYLGPNGIAEFDKYLKTNFPDDVSECKICKSIIFYGLKCGNPECRNLLHRKCIKERLKKFNNCPNCKGLWETSIEQPIVKPD